MLRPNLIKAFAVFAAVILAAAGNQLILAAAMEELDEGLSKVEQKAKRQEELDRLPLMKNLFRFRQRPQQPLLYRDRFGDMTS
jgi:hypothetical protein